MSDNDSDNQQVATCDDDNQVSSGSSNGSIPSDADEYDYSKIEDETEKITDNSYDYESHKEEKIHFVRKH
ncbi:hypothetical protein L5515_012585 [Caenorhabditis briggsae]|uniref:Uncharacterized protein n=1 Tax=Caenorhabditis briggsae TaxID=6238 RepID=A0AAE9EYL5_CAEBR|nr:hypothetical protein L5515_012585 [Caenorhabditis briggsae]